MQCLYLTRRNSLCSIKHLRAHTMHMPPSLGFPHLISILTYIQKSSTFYAFFMYARIFSFISLCCMLCKSKEDETIHFFPPFIAMLWLVTSFWVLYQSIYIYISICSELKRQTLEKKNKLASLIVLCIPILYTFYMLGSRVVVTVASYVCHAMPFEQISFIVQQTICSCLCTSFKVGMYMHACIQCNERKLN